MLAFDYSKFQSLNPLNVSPLEFYLFFSFIKNWFLTAKEMNKCGAKPFQCPQCKKRFHQLSGLKLHSLVHSGVRPFKCDICKMRFKRSGHLKGHSLVHSGVRSFKCDICYKRFHRLGDLKRHSLVHSGVRPFKCDICKKRFKLSGHLKRHSLVHSGVRSFKCTRCGKAFNRRSTLKHHSRSVHSTDDELPSAAEKYVKVVIVRQEIRIRRETMFLPRRRVL